jgi:hypothetical protein
MSKRIHQLNQGSGNMLPNDLFAIDRNNGVGFTTYYITGTQLINSILQQIPNTIYTSGTGLFSIKAINTSNIVASGHYSYASGRDVTASGDYSFIHSKDSIVSGLRSVVLGGENIIGTADDTVYVPNLELQGPVLGKYTQQPDTNPGFDDLTIVTKKWVEDNSASTLDEVLQLGNRTGSNDIIIDPEQAVVFEHQGFGIIEQTNIDNQSTSWMIEVNGDLYIINNNLGVIEKRDIDLNLINTYNVLEPPITGLRYNATLNIIYIGINDASTNRYYLDLNTDSITISLGTYSATNRFLDYDPVTNRIYVSNFNTNEIDIYNEYYNYIESIPTFTDLVDYNWIENNPNNQLMYLSAYEYDGVDYTPVIIVFNKVTQTETQRILLSMFEPQPEKIQIYDDYLLVLQSQYPVKIYKLISGVYEFYGNIGYYGSSDIRVNDNTILYAINNNFDLTEVHLIEPNESGWSNLDLTSVSNRNYDSFSAALIWQIGNVIIGKELIMKHVPSDTYYKIKFLSWTSGNNGGGFSYERQLITPAMDEPVVLFTKTDYGSEVDIIIPGELEITRDVSGPIYNSALEMDPWTDDGPLNTRWNSIYLEFSLNLIYSLDYYNGTGFGILPYNNFYYIGSNQVIDPQLFKLGQALGVNRLYTESISNNDWKLPNKSGTIALLDDVPNIDSQKYAGILFVDSLYGNDMTAQINNSLLPYQTITQALSIATNGDLIVVRPGTYIGSIILKDGVDFYFYENTVLFGNFLDNGRNVNCKVLGYCNLNGRISLSSNSSIIYIELLNINYSGAGAAILSNSNGNITIKFNNLIAGNNSSAIEIKATTSVNSYLIEGNNITCGVHALYLENQTNLVLNINNKISIQRTTFDEFAVGIYVRSAYIGKTYITTNLITINNCYAAILLGNNSSAGLLHVTADTIESTVDAVPNILVRGTISDLNSQCNLIVKARKITAIGGHAYVSTGNIPNSQTIIDGDLYSRDNYPMRINGIKRLIVQNSTISKLNTIDNNRLIVIGGPTSIGNLFNGQNNNLLVEFDNVKFLKSFTGTPTATEPIIVVDGTSSKIYMKNCEIIGLDLEPTTEAIYADTAPEGNIYFKNTITNLPVSTNITDTSLIGGLISNDLQLNTLKIIL